MRAITFWLGIEFLSVLAKHWGVYKDPSQAYSTFIISMLFLFVYLDIKSVTKEK